jgi:transketolase
VTIDGHDLDAVAEAIETAKQTDNGKPKLIIAKTIIGKGIPEVAGTAKGHGEGGAKFVDAAKKGLGIPEGTHFYVSDEVKNYFSRSRHKRSAAHAEWKKTFDRLGLLPIQRSPKNSTPPATAPSAQRTC